jgi:hypothetical protein
MISSWGCTVCTRSLRSLSIVSIRVCTKRLIHLMNNKMNENRRRKSIDNISIPNSLITLFTVNGLSWNLPRISSEEFLIGHGILDSYSYFLVFVDLIWTVRLIHEDDVDSAPVHLIVFLQDMRIIDGSLIMMILLNSPTAEQSWQWTGTSLFEISQTLLSIFIKSICISRERSIWHEPIVRVSSRNSSTEQSVLSSGMDGGSFWQPMFYGSIFFYFFSICANWLYFHGNSKLFSIYN